MDWKYLYLILDVGAISVPFAFSFYSKANFSRKWQYLLPAILLPGIVFIIWDVYFTKWGVWGFNDRYLTGLEIINLPVEEWLFFVCIPYACVFTYFSFEHLFKRDYLKNYARAISIILMIIMLIAGFLNLDKAYTSTTFISLAIVLAIHLWILKSDYLGKFFFSFIFILVPFFIINGVLTGSGIDQEVVWYNNAENLSIRMITIPVEDTFYGMLLLLLNVSLFEELQRSTTKRMSSINHN